MDISCCSVQLLTELQSTRDLPDEILAILKDGPTSQYLDTLAKVALDPKYIYLIYTTHEPVFVDICSRWLAFPETEALAALAALARILPCAPHLSEYATALLSKPGHKVLGKLATREVTALVELPVEFLQPLLLALCRLLSLDNEGYASWVSPAQLQLLLKHDSRPIRYLAIRILCCYLHAADGALASMINTCLGNGEIEGDWEDKSIDYTFYSLWEDIRIKDLNEKLQNVRRVYEKVSGDRDSSTARRIVRLEDLTRRSACIAGILVPRMGGIATTGTSLVATTGTKENLMTFAKGVITGKPLLVTGQTGAGKTSVIRDVSRELGRSASMLTLHLNEQSDVKLLVGMYTSSQTPGSFSWRPGVLTTAVMEGKWVFIEDLDRAPKDVISTLLPLIERRELLVPHWGETIRAAPGFKLIATMRSSSNSNEKDLISASNMIGLKHWHWLSFCMPPNEEFAEIASQQHPILSAYLPRMMLVYTTLKNQEDRRTFRSSKTLGPRDFLRWCRRIEALLVAAGITSGQDPISDDLNDQIFLEAVDSFLGDYPSDSSKDLHVRLIAQDLHIPEQRMNHCLKVRRPLYVNSETAFRVGRASLHKRGVHSASKALGQRSGHEIFAIPDHVLRVIESVAVAVQHAEPCLLVGETGAGKTTIVQRLATALNRNLTVVNLSQQSEAGDLLGGYKPTNMRALAVPMKDEFSELLRLTFPSNENQNFINALAKSVLKGRWSRALTLWQEALRMIENKLALPKVNAEETTSEPDQKKRKLQPRYQEMKARWQKFAVDVETFQMHLAGGSKAFGFSFVEGNIVKAARNGDWVLLDEISLASPDTLENLADLFSLRQEGGPSIMLPESGNAERIVAHKDFRIFGAMNPATDVGKRDLPLSLRSRFSEIFVEAPDKDLENLGPIVKAYLGSYSNTDVRASTDIAHLYLGIKRLLESRQLVDGANQSPHFSLRTLTRTLVFVTDVTPVYGLRRALYEGFAMGFLTSLNKESELLVQPLIDKYILGAHKNRNAILYQTPRIPQDGKRYVHFRHYWVAEGNLPIEQRAHYIITPFIERNLLNLVRATSTRRFPVLLQGPTSSGKTSMVEYLARISGNKFVRINNHEHTDLQEYLGTYVSAPDGQLQYQDGVLVEALKEGYWIVLDELNLAPTDVLEALNRLLDDNRELLIPETQQIVRPHDNFMLFATQNPPGLYGGRKVLSRAFKNRFLELHFDNIPEDELETILRERSQIAPSFCARIVSIYKKLSILRQSGRLFEQKNSFATLRDLFRWASREADDREQLAVNGFLLLAERVRDESERSAVKQVIEDVMKVKLAESQMYGNESLEKAIGHPFPAPQGIVWTQSMRRLYVLVTKAMRNNEPILLVGETGSGKTTICQVIAQLMNTQLHIVNGHQNMETGDLIGAQRPIRHKALIESQLASDIVIVLKDCGAYKSEYGSDCNALLEAYEILQKKAPGSLTKEMQGSVEKSKAKLNALFEWSDGSLVQAMRTGHHFLLDEISLADDSVLERLNSLLEPDRTLFLAEKGSKDSLVTASKGFQFLATMNPGGDYGKRELSPALRNRFTEIWVPSLFEKEEILEIIQAKLSPILVDLATPMVDFAAWFAATYDTATPGISIRDLLTWTQFINFSKTDTRFGVLHGAAMVYLDRLGANPAAKMSISEANINHERQKCASKLEETFALELVSLYNQKHSLGLDDEQVRIGPFSLSKTRSAPSDAQYSLQAPTTLVNAMKIMRALRMRRPILLEGSPGVGKTTLVAALADLIGVPLTRINLSDQTDLMDLFGSDVPLEGADIGHFGWREAPFLQAMQKGEWVLLDEMNLASQSVLEGLNACLDHRGEIFVSELNQTFRRHPNFVVFAAQNPHYQGGGRKGLPASFVNRFTVVYADTFTPEDLHLICTEVAPNVPAELTETLVHSITDLNSLFLDDKHLGIQGGPWEINLRDILRWLHLIMSHDGSKPMRKPTDYQNMVLLQRFRSSQDVLVIANSLRRHFGPDDRPHDYFHAKNDDAVEVGLANLTRDSVLQPVRNRRLTIPHQTALPIAESVMLCVQKNWPCLLVGASGSGKTNMIFQIASLVGADVTNLALSPEMDTMDLIGGYEQSDNRRGVAAFLKRLRAFNHKAIAEQLINHAWFNDQLLLVETTPGRSYDLSALLPSLENLAQTYPLAEYPRLLTEAQNLVQQSAVDNRARFEWIDGILVRALNEGKWLILDNANMCNPSVLDRLNSLLEPNGFLSINEHRTSNGSPRIVKPHPNFRLFLTMDPRHGELSRAMRNRSIELFMPTQSPSPISHMLGFSFESSLCSFEIFQSFNWHEIEANSAVFLLRICFDHLTFGDVLLSRRWQAQIAMGMSNLTKLHHDVFSSIGEAYQQMMSYDGVTMEGIRAAYGCLAKDGAMEANLESLQSIHPFNNSTIFNLKSSRISTNDLHHFGHAFEVLCDIYHFGQQLASVAKDVKFKPSSQMSRLETSIAPVASRKSRHDSTQPVGEFLQGTVLLLRATVDDKGIGRLEEKREALPLVMETLHYLQDVFHFTHSPDFDEGVFQAYLTIGKTLVARHKSTAGSTSLATNFANGLAHRFDAFNATWQLCSGLGMERLWSTFKPRTANSITQLRLGLQIEELADRFDALVWGSGAPLEELLTLRNSLIAFHGTIGLSGDEMGDSLQEIRAALDDLENRPRLASSGAFPYFREQFEAISQFEAYQDPQTSTSHNSVQKILSGTSTKASMDFGAPSETWKTLSDLQRATGIGESRVELAAIRQVLPISSLRQLLILSEVPLGSLNLLSNEIEILGKAITQTTPHLSCNHLSRLDVLLARLHATARESLIRHFDAAELENLSKALDFLPSRLRGETLDQNLPENQRSRRLETAVSMVLVPSTPKAQYESDQRGESMKASATRWIQFFTGCLLLYVPDRTFDPALKSRIDQARHQKRRAELQLKLHSLQEFEKIYSGQKTNYRIMLAEKTLEDLGKEPEVALAIRPEKSELAQLQGEFKNILRSIVLLAPDAPVIQAAFDGDVKILQSLELRRRDIATAVARLSKKFRVYDDITRPLIAMLHGLDIGLVLAQICATGSSPEHEAIKYICKSTPFLGAEPGTLSNLDSIPPSIISSHHFEPRILHLKSIATVQAMKQSDIRSISWKMAEIFHSFYEQWKEKLSQDMEQHAAKSSLYRYRNGEAESEESEQEDFLQLFPDYKQSEETGVEKNILPLKDPSNLARCLAPLHRQLFANSLTATERILDLLSDASKDLAKIWQGTSNRDLCPVPAENLVPALILSLDLSTQALNSNAETGRMYNFYVDANIAEIRKLVSLIHRVQLKFLELQEAWPEHATLNDVLRTCTELLMMRHTEPIAKILTKVEQLYGYMHEWQVVASREYTTANLYGQLTDLLIGWRRLELSTWAKLLDMEDEKCGTDADTWWFVAYESLVAVPLSMIESQEDLTIHAERLFSTLEDFLSTTSIGQYSHRLDIIDSFTRHVQLLAIEKPQMQEIYRALSNLLRYYRPFTKPAQETIQKGRSALEKDLKEILLLASWKDTNIVALRDSAKRSHHKLFKVVRKYRALLAQSAEVLLTKDIFKDKKEAAAPLPDKANVLDFKEIDLRALEICRQNVDTWQTKPARFTNPNATSQRMHSMSQIPPVAIDGASQLDLFVEELIDNINLLRKETPSAATKENVGLIKHLKARKSKIFSETLKSLREMGFRSNLSTDVLRKQASRSLVLSSIQTFEGISQYRSLLVAESHFYHLLNVMPQLKEKLGSHSDDLSHGDVSRSMGFLESITSVIVKQRDILAISARGHEKLGKAIETMANVWAPDNYELLKVDGDEETSTREALQAVRCLPPFLEVGYLIIEKYAKLGVIDASVVLDGLSYSTSKMKGVNHAIDLLPGLPSALNSSLHKQHYDDAARTVQELMVQINQWIIDHPHLSFALKQIQLWITSPETGTNAKANNVKCVTISQLDENLSETLDSILVAMQRMQETISSIPVSKDDPHWLLRIDTLFSRSHQDLHSDKVTSMIEGILCQLQHIEPLEAGTLQVAGAVCAMALPIVLQYQKTVLLAFERHAGLHQSLCRLSYVLAQNFYGLVQEGFCSPSEGSASESGKTEKLEGGTGLGEGEGAEDISKDIQDDEDLSELAQQAGNEKRKEDIEEQDDAVDMDHDELEGEMGDESVEGEDYNSGSEAEDNEMDDETGTVDDLDPSAVDEKMWDGKREETQKEKEGSKGNGEPDNDEQTAAEGDEQKEIDSAQDGEEDELSQDGAEEGENVMKDEPEKMDPHVQESQNLDLPEEMDLDNIDGTASESESGEDNMSETSNAELHDTIKEDETEFEDGVEDNSMKEAAEDGSEDGEEQELGEDGTSDVGTPLDAQAEDDGQLDDQGPLKDKGSRMATEQENRSEDQQTGQDQLNDDETQGDEGKASGAPNQDVSQAPPKDGKSTGQGDQAEGGQVDDAVDERPAFKKLGDALEKWHRQQKQIRAATERTSEQEAKTADTEMPDQEFEHLQEDGAEADAQALGAASNEQARALDERALESEMPQDSRPIPPDESSADENRPDDVEMQDIEEIQRNIIAANEQARPSTFMADNPLDGPQTDRSGGAILEHENDIINPLDADLPISDLHLTATQPPPRSQEDARNLWTHYSSQTHSLSLTLTEQLRLILAPTLATKMRGDFRTGKRLNIKRIIPYIASQYKRDKIWMRRSVPSKRAYQILLAVDDSQSMGSSGSGSGALAFETLALVAKSLSMLEAGDLCIVGFGQDVVVAHPFSRPFSDQAGATAFRHFGFQQPKTDVRKLIAESIDLFREARRSSQLRSGAADLWQLQLIISDGVCEDHESIRRLVRRAMEERIMIVFVIVDGVGVGGGGEGQSIVDMSQAVFETDDAAAGEGGLKVRMKRYLDGFPFRYYLVVGDVRELPGVLAKALRVWFAEVVESG